MRIEELKNQIEVLKPVLSERFKVETIGIFGSYVRGEQKRKSDLEVLVEFSGKT
jgi:predicted nucleotidyltransferase